MDFHFKLQRAKGGYYFDENNELHPTAWFKKDNTEEVIFAEEIHKQFVEILHPYHDLVAQKKAPKNYSGIKILLNKESKLYMPELEDDIKFKIMDFADEYGMGGFFEPEHVNPDYTLEGFSDKSEHPNLYNLIDKAIDMNRLLLARKSYETVPPRLKEICNLYAMFLRPRLNGGMYMETDSIFATMFWGMAFTEYTYRVKQCEYCQAPLLTDMRARFCKPPRQCKNRFNNAKRPKKKESK
ncbi:hypothetical protein N9I34_00185 [Gammaproteobacteria bacterium]|nr:hypothetical protein [Gammaproteobacteria bacterium]